MANVRLPIVEGGAGSLAKDGRRRWIIPADLGGRFNNARRVVFLFLIGLMAALPWIKIKGAPAVFLDIQTRRFYLFGATFNAQDAWLLFFLVSGTGFSLVYVTALLGRAWCGWACPQTVFLEGVYRRIERFFEGPREQRLRPNAHTAAWRVLGKHAAYAVVSLFVAHIVLSYFVSIPATFQMVRHSPSDHPEAFAWVVGITALLYGNFAWFREQFCVVMCPYGRLQSVLLDDDSLVVGYDQKRGEPRGKKGTEGAGDCVDCKRCVVVCPTGIDIRNGLQLDCLACTACIDACDDVMDRLKRPRGLVRYDSPKGLAGKARRIIRPRIMLYTGMLLLGVAVMTIALRSRQDFEANILRLRGQPYTLEGGSIRNAFELHLVNKRGETQTFEIRFEPGDDVSAVVSTPKVTLGPMEGAHVPVFFTMPRDKYRFDVPIRLRVTRVGAPASDAKLVQARFLGAKAATP